MGKSANQANQLYAATTANDKELSTAPRSLDPSRANTRRTSGSRQVFSKYSAAPDACRTRAKAACKASISQSGKGIPAS